MDILNIFKKKNKINKIYLIVKITNYEIFDETFMPLPGVSRVQPHWEYFSDKGVIKIDLNQEIVDFLNHSTFNYTFDELFAIKFDEDYLITIDKSCFTEFSNLILYVEYTLNNQDYINFYRETDTICSQDFTTKNFKNQQIFNCKAYIMSIKSNLLEIDITDYIKLFVNNKNEIPIEIFLLYYNINMNLNNMLLKLI